MTEELGPVENVGRARHEPDQHRRVERLLIVRPQDGADDGGAASELEDLPGVVSVTLNTLTRSFDIVFDSAVVSDDELAAALRHQGYDLIGWQEARQLHAAEQRGWLLEQIRSLASRTELELAERGTYAGGTRNLRGWRDEGIDRCLRPSRQGVRSRHGRRDHPADPGWLPRRALSRRLHGAGSPDSSSAGRGHRLPAGVCRGCPQRVKMRPWV
jgi:hypothetical protein